MLPESLRAPAECAQSFATYLQLTFRHKGCRPNGNKLASELNPPTVVQAAISTLNGVDRLGLGMTMINKTTPAAGGGITEISNPTFHFTFV